MGTRHLTCVVKNGEFVVAQYGQWDGYLEGQGETVRAFLAGPGNVDRLESALPYVREATDQELEAMDARLAAEKKSVAVLFPLMTRDTGAEVLEKICAAHEAGDDPILLKLDVEFAADPLFCEWAYVVDFDARALEIYGGPVPNAGVEQPRFGHLIGKPSNNTHREETFQEVIGLLRVVPFTELPASWDSLQKEIYAEEAEEECEEA